MALEFKNIAHHYRGSQFSLPKGSDGLDWTMENVSLRIEKGEILSLFGPSGCGKTTLLRLAAGLETLQAGEILLDGQTLAKAYQGQLLHNMAPEKRAVGFVFQDYVLFPHLTVLDNIKFGLAHLSQNAQREEADASLKNLRLEGLEKRYPHQLSGGQQQRVALARALARQPSALLLDEPFASIGADLRRALQEEMRHDLKTNGVAAVFITHDSEEALLMGDRIALMKEGRLIEDNEAAKLYDTPQTMDAALLFSGHQMVSGHFHVGMIVTPFGSCEAGLVRAAPPPNDDKKKTPLKLVLGEGAISIDDSLDKDDHRAQVRDCRFVGPDYLTIIHSSTKDISARVVTKRFFTNGTLVQCSLNPQSIKFIDYGV